MTGKGRTVTVDAEWLLNRLDALDRAIADIRKRAAQGVYARPDARPASPASPAGINLRLLEWKTKENQPASEADPWAWAFAYTYEGGLLPAADQLVQEIQRTGKVEVAGYEITLSGRDKKLLSRKKIGSRRR